MLRYTKLQTQTDSVECLKELQRALRRDANNENKDVYKQLGTWNVLGKDLLPLLITYREDEQLSFEICRVHFVVDDNQQVYC